ncbi:hypothetical protein MHM98_01060 [Psychrobium sp. MM17-31]|uniref:hypothetical protein n=1 Tax=Psychrobium sp. MM17-31 TaxID=2917758 RepID=UPI001EF58F61|nr:hypothetical protein [Psychrobium sp. MM17-31]MCG7529952.1 hypothetical protein [Psychrobium sp. MM17-31]
MRKLLLILLLISQYCSAKDYTLMNDEELETVLIEAIGNSFEVQQASGKKYAIEHDVYMYDAYYFSKFTTYNGSIQYRNVTRIIKAKPNKNTAAFEYDVVNYRDIKYAPSSLIDQTLSFKTATDFDLGLIKPIVDMLLQAQKQKYNSDNDLTLVGNWTAFAKHLNATMKIDSISMLENGLFDVTVTLIEGQQIISWYRLDVDIIKRTIESSGVIL